MREEHAETIESKISLGFESHLKTAIIAFGFFVSLIALDFLLGYLFCSSDFVDCYLMDPMNYLKPLAAISSFAAYIYAIGALDRYKTELASLVNIKTKGMAPSEKKQIEDDFLRDFNTHSENIRNKKRHLIVGILFTGTLILTASQSPKYGDELFRFLNFSSIAYSFALGVLLVRFYGWAQLIHLTTKYSSPFAKKYYNSENLTTVVIMAEIGKRAHKFSFSMIIVTIIYIQIAITSVLQLLPLEDTSHNLYLAIAIFWILFSLTYCAFFMVSTTYHVYRFVEMGKSKQIRKLYHKTNEFIDNNTPMPIPYDQISASIKDVEEITTQVFGIKQLLYAIAIIVISAGFNGLLYLFYSGT